MKKVWLTPLLTGLLCAGAILPAAVTVKESASGITLENDYVMFEVVKRGGKIGKFVDKVSKQDLLGNDSGIYAGLGKVRDMFGNSLGMMIGARRLSVKSATPDKAEVEAVYSIRGGLIDGMEVVKTYTLSSNSPAVEFKELYRSKVKKNRFAINWHNRFAVKANSVDIVFSSGKSSINLAQAITNRNNYMEKSNVDYLGWVNTDTKNGVVLRVNEKNMLENFYVWGDELFSLEANFRDVSIQPTVGIDEWIISGTLTPFAGFGRIVAVNRDAVVSLSQADGKTFANVAIVRELGKGKIKVSGAARDQVISGELKVGKVFKFELGSKACQIILDVANKESVITVPSAADLAVSGKIATKIDVRKTSGINGFYYYYPQMYVSEEIPAEVAFGLQGNFGKVKNFRLALALPPGLDVTYSVPKGSYTGEVKIKDKTYRQYEFKSFRTSSYSFNIPMDILANAKFKDSDLYLWALWDGGSQTPERIQVKRVDKLPKIGKGLKRLYMGLNVTSRLAQDWKVPQYDKLGVNFIEYWEYNPQMSFLKPHPDNAFTPYIEDAKKKNIKSFIEVGTAYTRVGDAVRGYMQEELGTLHYPVKSYEKIKLNDILAVDHNGKQVKMVCPSNRSRYYQKTLDTLRVYISYGFENIAFDEEAWSNGATICFCERCKGEFKKFLQKKYPDIKYQSPEITVTEPGKHKALENAWWDFKTDLIADLYRSYREEIDRFKNKSGQKRELFVWLSSSVGKGRYGAITDRLTDYRKMGKYIDWAIPMLYTDNSMQVGESSKFIANNVLTDTRAKLIMGLCPNRYYEYFRIEAQSMGTEAVVLEQILESVFNGARGVIFWSHRGCFRGALDFRNVAMAVKMLMPVEDILLDGKRVELAASNPAVTVTAFKLDSRYAVFLRNYETGKIRTTLNVPAGLKVYDTLSGKEVSKEVELDKCRVKVLEIK